MANAIQITAKLYDNRDNVLAILGPDYKDVLAKCNEPLQGYATRNNVSVIDAALTLSEEMKKAGHGGGIPYLLAAAVEILEPFDANVIAPTPGQTP